MVKALFLIGLIFSWSCRAGQAKEPEVEKEIAAELKLCINQSPDQITCVVNKQGQWTLRLSFPKSQLFLNNQVELYQSDICNNFASYSEFGKEAFLSCFKDDVQHDAHAYFEVDEQNETTVILKNISMLLYNRESSEYKQINYHRITFSRHSSLAGE